jgi:hypothetical protein
MDRECSSPHGTPRPASGQAKYGRKVMAKCSKEYAELDEALAFFGIEDGRGVPGMHVIFFQLHAVSCSFYNQAPLNYNELSCSPFYSRNHAYEP